MRFSRRHWLAGLSILTCLSAAPAMAEIPTLDQIGAAFSAMPMDVRLRAQGNMIASDLYRGTQDGAWGPGTAEGFRQLMTLPVYRDFARTLPADATAAAQATVLWAAPEFFAD